MASDAGRTRIEGRSGECLYIAKSPNLEMVVTALPMVGTIAAVCFFAALACQGCLGDLAWGLGVACFVLSCAALMRHLWWIYTHRSFAPGRFAVYPDRIEVIGRRDLEPRHTIELIDIRHLGKKRNGRLLLRGVHGDHEKAFETSLAVGPLVAEDRFDDLVDCLEATGHLFSHDARGERMRWSRPWHLADLLPGFGTARSVMVDQDAFVVDSRRFPFRFVHDDAAYLAVGHREMVVHVQTDSLLIDDGLALADVWLDAGVRKIRFGCEDWNEHVFSIPGFTSIYVDDRVCGQVQREKRTFSIEMVDPYPVPILLGMMLVSHSLDWRVPRLGTPRRKRV